MSQSLAKNLTPVEGWPYSVSPNGYVVSHYTGRRMRSRAQNKGYQMLILRNKGKRKAMLVHRLVAMAFVPNPDDLPYVNHKDGNKSNNCASNLEWCTASENLAHAHKNRLARSGARLTDRQAIAMRRLMQYGMSSTQLSKLTGFSLTYLGHIKHGRLYKHAQEFINAPS